MLLVEERLMGASYRLAVCDLEIPSHDGWMDASVDHGLSIIEQLRRDQPEVPVLIFSGRNPSLSCERMDVEGLTFFNKSQLPECLAAVKAAMGRTT